VKPMHVLLIQPSQFRNGMSLLYGRLGTIDQPPMSLAMLAAVLLEAGFEVDILDMDAEGASAQDVCRLIKSRDTGLVGLSVTTPIYKNALELCQEIKRSDPAIPICMGGYHPTATPDACLKSGVVDYVVRGEGELTLLELANAIKQGSAGMVETVAGLSFKKGGRIFSNPDRELVADLDSLPFPARHLFTCSAYSYPDTRYSPAFPLYTSRGCPGRCTFCQQRQITGGKLRSRSAGRVADEVEHLVSRYGAREIQFFDDMFTLNRKRVFEIRDEFLARNIKVAVAFTGGIRVDTATREVLKAMREMGGYSIAFGIESGDQEILDRSRKGITLEQARKAVAMAKEAGLETTCFFMVGLLGESHSSIKKTIDFALELDPDIAKFHVLKPFPGTQVHRQMKEHGLITDYNFENYGIHTYPVHRTEELSQEDIHRYQKIAYRRFYFRPRIILKHISRINSRARLIGNLKMALGVGRLAFR